VYTTAEKVIKESEAERNVREAAKLASEAEEKKAETDLKKQQATKQFLDNVDNIFKDNSLPTTAKKLKLAKLFENEPNIEKQVDKVNKIIEKLASISGFSFQIIDDSEAPPENQTRTRERSLTERMQVTLDNLFSQIEAGKIKELNLIIRADVQESVDVLKKYLSELSTNEIKIKILHTSPGGITEGDVVLAEASNAIIIGFNVAPEERAAKIAESKGVEIRLYNAIYQITEDLQKSMAGLLEPEETEKSLGRAVVREIFKISRVGIVAGCYVSSGVVNKNAKMRLIRDNIVLKDNLNIETLKHFKDDVREVKADMECGIKIAGFDDVKVDDVFDFY